MIVRLGIDLGGTFIKAGIIDSKYAVKHTIRIPSNADKGGSHVKHAIEQAYHDLIDYCKKHKLTALSVGIGSPGTIRQPEGRVTDASPNIRGWRNTMLTKILPADLPVYADNDANCAALAEYIVGLKCRYSNVVFVTLGTGIGGGIIISGRLLRGSSFAAAEVGHTVLKQGGRRCKCGRQGCLEAYASVPNLMKRYSYWQRKCKQNTDRNMTPRELIARFKSGEKAALLAIKENADYLGAGLGSIVNVLNPEAVVIGGGFSESSNAYLNLIKEAIKSFTFDSASKSLKITGSKLGNKAGFIGAALLYRVESDGAIAHG